MHEMVMEALNFLGEIEGGIVIQVPEREDKARVRRIIGWELGMPDRQYGDVMVYNGNKIRIAQLGKDRELRGYRDDQLFLCHDYAGHPLLNKRLVFDICQKHDLEPVMDTRHYPMWKEAGLCLAELHALLEREDDRYGIDRLPW